MPDVPETMQALVVQGPSRFEIQEVPVPNPDPTRSWPGSAPSRSAGPTPT